MSKNISKGKGVKKALKSAGQIVGALAKSRVIRRFFPLFGLVVIFKPSISYAFTVDAGTLEFGKNGGLILRNKRNNEKWGCFNFHTIDQYNNNKTVKTSWTKKNFQPVKTI